MSSNRLAPRWSIPGIGRLRPRYDAVRIVSSATVGALKTLLPIAKLEKASHQFKVVRHRGKDTRLRSEIRFSCADDFSTLQILATNELNLGSYRVVQVEIAFDVDADSDDDASKKLSTLVKLLSKPWHSRKHLELAHKPEATPGPGYMAQPTFYFEDRRSRMALKCYCRYAKLKGGDFGTPCVRLEWTLNGKATIERHLGGNKIGNLLARNLNEFVKDNLRLEKVDHVAIGDVFRGLSLGKKRPPVLAAAKAKPVRSQFKDQAVRSERAANLLLRKLAYHNEQKLGGWQNALMVCQNSPAQIRGYLNRLQKIESLRRGRSHLTSQQKKGLRKRGRPKQGQKRQRAISAYRINACFKRIQLEPV